jgi:aminopeptidase
LLNFCRLGPDDPPNGWVEHAQMLSDRARTMTDRNFAELRFSGPGTDLHVGLAADGIWLGGGEVSAEGRVTYPNFPTEEIFTSPVAGATRGTFRCTTPLTFNGRVIDAIAGEFARGRLIRVDAERESDRQLLERTFHTDGGAGRLGEVALVDSASRIGQAGHIFGETLLDENAASHIAFGNGFGGTRSAGGRINRSVIHIDVMIGSSEISTHGVTQSGQVVPIIVDGDWRLS